MKRRWKKFLAGLLSAALMLNVAAPLALANSPYCRVGQTTVTTDPQDPVQGDTIHGTVSYRDNTLTFTDRVEIGSETEPVDTVIHYVGNSELTITADDTVEGWANQGIFMIRDIRSGTFICHSSDGSGMGLSGESRGTTVGKDAVITLDGFGTGISAGNVTIEGAVYITGAGCGISDGGKKLLPGGTLSVEAEQLISGALEYAGGHLILKAVGEGKDRGWHNLNVTAPTVYYRTSESGSFVRNENGTLAQALRGNPDYLELLDETSQTCEVTFDLNGAEGEAPQSQYLLPGDTVTLPTPPTREGYTFGGWYTDAEGENEFVDGTPVHSDTTLYANWIENGYALWVSGVRVNEKNAGDVLGDGTVSFDPDSNTLTLKNAFLTVNGSIESKLADLTITGSGALNSKKDAIDAEGRLTLDGANLSITTSERAIAGTEKLVITNSRLMLFGTDEDGGDIAIRAVGAGGFGGGDAEITGSEIWIGSISGTDEDLYEFGIRGENLTVTDSRLELKTEDRSIWLGNEMTVSGRDTVILADATDCPSLGVEADKLILNDGLYLEGTVNESMTVQIRRPWQVTFDLNGAEGEAPQAQQVRDGETATEPEVPTRTGYTFTGWYLDEACSEECWFDRSVTTDLTLYAGWKENEKQPDQPEYKVGWVLSEGDEVIKGSPQLPGAIFTEETQPLFVGWFLADGTRLEDSPYYLGAESDHVAGDGNDLDHDVIFYARWCKPDQLRTLSFADGSVEVNSSIKVYSTLHTEGTAQVAPGAIVTLTLDKNRLPEGMQFSGFAFSTIPEDVETEGMTVTFVMPDADLSVWADTGMDSPEEDLFTSGSLAAGATVTGIAGVILYEAGTELVLECILPKGVAVPKTRAALAQLLWNTAGRPAPAGAPAFADVTDPELAAAAQWTVEQGYLKAQKDGTFGAEKGVTKWRVLRSYSRVSRN